jgi:hypothetical protein
MALATTVLALVGAAGADWPPRLVGSFAAPPGAIDVAYEWGPLYALVGGSKPTVFVLNDNNGSIIQSFRVPVPNGSRGITYETYPSRMWVSNRINRHVYRLTTTGSLAGSFVCPGGAPYGLGYSYFSAPHGRGLFVTCRDENLVLNVDSITGSVIGSFAGPASAALEYDDCFCVDRDSNYLYWDYYSEWRVLDTLPARPWGVATGVDKTTDQAIGVRSFVLCDNGYIYCYSGTESGNVAPASLGRVKALFR